MKKHLFSLALFMAALKLFGQADLPTYGYNYQAIIRDDKDQPVVNQPIQLRFSILNTANTKLYEETQAVTTDAFGRAVSVVGSGAAVLGKFDTLNWAARKHYLGVTVKIGGGGEVALGGKEEIVLEPTAKGGSDWLLNGKNIYRLDGNLGLGVKPEDNFSKFSVKKNSNEDTYIAWFEKNGTGAAYIGFKSGTDPSNANPRRTYFGFSDSEFSINALKPGTNNTRLKLNGENGLANITCYRMGINIDVPQATLDVNGDARVKTLTILGSDRAHRFNTTTGSPIPAGTVVVFDETQPGKIRPCAKAYDRNIPGIVSDESGKGKYHPGIIHEQEDTKNGSPVALDGTVEAFAVGPIAIGDYLTTSNVPGHAMRTKNRRKSEGAEIGRALTPLAKGKKGKVEVFVGRD